MTKALVVDDERKMRRVLQMLLERMGIESVAADSAEEALALVEREQVDLVLTDLRMPGMSGIELLTRVHEADPDVPVIVLTAYGTVETAVEAMKRGAFDYRPEAVRRRGDRAHDPQRARDAALSHGEPLPARAGRAGAGVREPHRRLGGDAGGLRTGPPRGADAQQRADHGRDGHRARSWSRAPSTT